MAEVRTPKPATVETEPVTDAATIAAQTLGVPKTAKPSSLWKDAWRRFIKNKLAIAGIVIMLIISIPVIGADLFQRYDPTISQYDRSPGAPRLFEQNYQAPSEKFWFGTDGQNRDLWARMLHGGRVSLLVGVFVQAIVLLVGVPLGLMAGFFGGRVDTLIMFIVNIFYAFPSLLAGLLFLSAFGSSIIWVLIAIGVGLWPPMARLIRGQVLSLREKEFVEAARAIGVKPGKMMFRHIFPNTLGPIIVSVSFGVPQAIQIEAFYGFIGVSVPPPATSWGQLVNDGFRAFQSNSVTILLIPALAIALTCMSLNFIGDGLRDAFDPKTKNK
jgi:ABC-type dipeptide/oligopeptide/nickel transport system permease subunit